MFIWLKSYLSCPTRADVNKNKKFNKKKLLISQACSKNESDKLKMILKYFIAHFYLLSSTQIKKCRCFIIYSMGLASSFWCSGLNLNPHGLVTNLHSCTQAGLGKIDDCDCEINPVMFTRLLSWNLVGRIMLPREGRLACQGNFFRCSK